MTADDASGPNIDAMKSESLDVLTSAMEEELLVEAEGGAEEVEAMGFVPVLEEVFRASRIAFTLLAYSQVSAR